MKMYELKLRDNVKELTFTIKVEGDVNDGDGVMEETILNEEEFNLALPYILALFKLNWKRHGNEERNKIWEQYYSEDEIENLNWYITEWISIPSCEWGEAHTIEGINITAQKDGMIYDVIIDKNKVLPIPLND